MKIPLANAKFQLDASGVAGFFGGDEAVAAMATVHMYRGRRWLGWYNSPGSYTIAKKYGGIASSPFWRGLYPGKAVDAAVLFELDGVAGPTYRGVRSGTHIKDTGHIGYLFFKACKSAKSTKIEGRVTTPVTVAIAQLNHAPEENKLRTEPLYSPVIIPIAAIPILCTLAACVACGVYSDWYCFSMILLGMLSSGISCFVLGSGVLYYSHPIPAKDSPPGDGIIDDRGQITVVLGKEGAVNAVTRGRFTLEFDDDSKHQRIGICSLLLTTQFLLQLLLIPQGQLFGQIMFLSTLAVSWAYNCFLASSDRENIQTDLLMQSPILDEPSIKSYELGTRTSAVVFTLLALNPPDPIHVLNMLLPNDTPTWGVWKEKVNAKLKEAGEEEEWVFDANADAVGDCDKELLRTLYGDASSAYNGFRKRPKDPVDEDLQKNEYDDSRSVRRGSECKSSLHGSNV